MQVFSKLQRNSTYLLFKIIFLVLVAILNSKYLFFPLIVGFVVVCEEFFLALFYIILFCILHEFNVLALFAEFMVIRAIMPFLKKLINEYYFEMVMVLLVYIGLYFIIPKVEFLMVYLGYNLAVDIVLARLKCARR